MQPLPQLTLEHFFNQLRRASQVVLMAKNSLANTGGIRNMGSIPGLGRSPEEEMATHCSILARRIPWTKEPGMLQSMRLQSIAHNWSNWTPATLLLFPWPHSAVKLHYLPADCSISHYNSPEAWIPLQTNLISNFRGQYLIFVLISSGFLPAHSLPWFLLQTSWPIV